MEQIVSFTYKKVVQALSYLFHTQGWKFVFFNDSKALTVIAGKFLGITSPSLVYFCSVNFQWSKRWENCKEDSSWPWNKAHSRWGGPGWNGGSDVTAVLRCTASWNIKNGRYFSFMCPCFRSRKKAIRLVNSVGLAFLASSTVGSFSKLINSPASRPMWWESGEWRRQNTVNR